MLGSVDALVDGKTRQLDGEIDLPFFLLTPADLSAPLLAALRVVFSLGMVAVLVSCDAISEFQARRSAKSC